MEKFSCIIVEDEPLATEVLQDYIAQTPFLQLKATCNDAMYAMELLQRERVDVIFLDIHLPRLKGYDFIKALKHPPQIIITSAHQEYALKGYELNILDYLLKPIEFSRFLMAVNKLRPSGGMQPAKERAAIFFNVNKKKVKVYLDEILYIESLKEYIRITTCSKSILTKFQMGQIEEMLESNQFLRVHRSFIVARGRVDAFTATDIEVGGKQIPIGRNYKDAVISLLEQGV